MYYCDTSFVAPLVVPEPTSDELSAFLAKRKRYQLAVSLWTTVEFSSLVSRRVRMGELTEDNAHTARAAFRKLVAASYRVLLPGASDYDLAAKLLENYKTALRAGDALHLAISKNNGATMIYSLDEGFLRAARLLKIRASPGILRSRI